MDTTSSYRIAWQPPGSVHVKAQSRSAVLDALEQKNSITRRELLAATGLSPLTLRRACRQLAREGVIAFKYGHDPLTGRVCERITLAAYPILPILEISDRQMVWRLCSTCGDSIFATVQECNSFRSPEDNLELLMSRVSAILQNGACGFPSPIPLQAPILLRDPSNRDIETVVRRVLDTPPCHIRTPEEAVAHELEYLPSARAASCVLHVTVGGSGHASLLIRQIVGDPISPWIPAPFSEGLDTALQNILRNTPRHSSAQWEQVRALLQSVFRIVTPDCLILEHDAPHTPEAIHHSLLPPKTALYCFPFDHNTPTLSHRGALRLSRRTLWDTMTAPTEKDPIK